MYQALGEQLEVFGTGGRQGLENQAVVWKVCEGNKVQNWNTSRTTNYNMLKQSATGHLPFWLRSKCSIC